MSTVTLAPRPHQESTALQADSALAAATSARSALVRAIAANPAGASELYRMDARLGFGIDRLVEHRATWLLHPSSRHCERLALCASMLLAQANEAQVAAYRHGEQRAIAS